MEIFSTASNKLALIYNQYTSRATNGTEIVIHTRVACTMGKKNGLYVDVSNVQHTTAVSVPVQGRREATNKRPSIQDGAASV